MVADLCPLGPGLVTDGAVVTFSCWLVGNIPVQLLRVAHRG